MLEAVRAVAFDLDNTLWDVAPVLQRAEARLFAWLEERCPRITARMSVEDMRRAREALAVREPHQAHDFTYLRIAALESHAREHGYAPAIAREAFEVFLSARCEVELFADVAPALRRLRARYPLASLSNGNADLGRIGLRAMFSVCLHARDLGAAKPAARCFEALAQALELPPQQILYVGDEPELDVVAAHAAGLRSAWINRRGAPWPAQLAAPDLTVVDCLQLATALGA